MASPRQIRAARALLGWTQADLADAAGVGLSAARDVERGDVPASVRKRGVALNPDDVLRIERALIGAGVRFLSATGSSGEGVRLASRDGH